MGNKDIIIIHTYIHTYKHTYIHTYMHDRHICTTDIHARQIYMHDRHTYIHDIRNNARHTQQRTNAYTHQLTYARTFRG